MVAQEPVEPHLLAQLLEVAVALEPVAAGHLHQHEAPVLLLVLGLEAVADLLDPGGGDLEQLGEQVGVDRLLGDHQDRLDGARRFGGDGHCLYPSYVSTRAAMPARTERSSSDSPPTHVMVRSPKVAG